MVEEGEGEYAVRLEGDVGKISAGARAIEAIERLSEDYDLEFRDNSHWLNGEYEITVDTSDAPVIRLDPDEEIDEDVMDEFYDDFVDAI